MTTCFVFDLDGTITKQELLPLIAKALGIEQEIKLLTNLTLKGMIPFEDSFRLRCAILKSVPLSLIKGIVSEAPLDSSIEKFIQRNVERCFVATGNLDAWIEPLVKRLGCRVFSSRGLTEGDTLKGITYVLHKNLPVLELKKMFKTVTVIGESVNDLPMFEVADIGIAFGGTHAPVNKLIQVADYIAYDGGALCRLLNTL